MASTSSEHVLFRWNGGGDTVVLNGSFNGWKGISMNKSTTGVFEVAVPLSAGTHEYKFIVDEEWRHDQDQPSTSDNCGGFNNVISVSGGEPSEFPLQDTHQDKTQFARLYEEALKEGYVMVSIIVCRLLGTAGVGKTCLKHLLLDLLPPAVRNSTSCVDKTTRIPIRPVSQSRINVEKGEISKWVAASDGNLFSFVAEAILICERIAKQPLPEEDKKYRLELLAVDESQPGDTSSLSTDPNSQSLSSKGQTSVFLKASEEVKRKLDEEISKKRKAGTHDFLAESLIRTPSDWVYLTDCGGQSRFFELLSLFIYNTSTALFVFRLPDCLDKPPSDDYFHDGKCVSSFPPDQDSGPVAAKPIVTTSETLQRLVCSVHSCSSEEQPLRVMIIGTHKDLVNEPSVVDKNEESIRSIFADSKHSDTTSLKLVYGDQQNNKVLFQLNTLHPQYDDKANAQTIRREIEKSPAAVKKQVPIRWYVLELMLRQLAKQLKRRVLSRSECLKIASILRFPEEVFVAALKFFDRLCIFHYYPEILPEVVFVDSQVLVDMVTKLIEYCFRFRQPSSSSIGLRLEFGDWQSFKYHGVITPEILHNPEFSTHFAEPIFTSYDFLTILQRLLVVAPYDSNVASQAIPKETDKYFMPSLLEAIKLRSLNNITSSNLYQ